MAGGGDDRAAFGRPAAIPVWDPLLRVFHWGLAAAVGLAYVTAEDAEPLHLALGYAVIGLIGFRLIWGLVGPKYARFSDFVRSPAAVLAYLRDLLAGRAGRHLGHNPAGGAMVVALLLTLAAVAGSGWALVPGAPEWIEEVHEALSALLAGLIALHVVGVVVHGVWQRENLIAAMITGRKHP